MSEKPDYVAQIRDAYGEAGGLPMHENHPIYVEIATSLEPLKDDAIEKKRPIEERMLRALQQYNGWNEGTIGNTKTKPLDSKSHQDEPPVVHITRQITDQITAKIINILLPSNERNWEIEATPDPELQEPLQTPQEQPVIDETGQPVQNQHTGQPVTEKEAAQAIRDEADKRAKRMQRIMDDQLEEAKFTRKGRGVLKNGCKVGTGILHGPFMTGKTKVKRRKHEATDEMGNQIIQWSKEVIQDDTADCVDVDPFCFFPEPVESIEKAEYAWLHELMSRSEVAKLKSWPGFEERQIDILLRQKPNHGKMVENLKKRIDADSNAIETKNRYSMWRYFGPLKNSVLYSLGVLEPGDEEDHDPEDFSGTTMAEVWMCQGIVIKVAMTPMEESRRLPFYVWNYEPSQTSIFGYGIPDQLRDSQFVIDSSWRMLLHNAALTSGPLILMLTGMVKPMDGDYTISGGLKQFEIDNIDPGAGGVEGWSMDKFMKVFNIEANIKDLMAINERAIQLAQQETNFPVMAQGEPTEAMSTVGGLAMLMNAQTVAQREKAQMWDDSIMIPFLTEVYDFDMQYNDNNDAKGDYNVVAYGATRLVNKDMQSQHLQVIAALAEQPLFQGYAKPFELWKEILKAADTDYERLSISDEEYQQLQQQPNPIQQLQQQEQQAKTAEAVAKAKLAEQKLAEAGQPQDQQWTPEQQIKLQELQVKEDGQARDLQGKEMELRSLELRAYMSGQIKRDELDTLRQERMNDRQLKSALKERELTGKEFSEGQHLRMRAEENAMRKENMSRGFDTEMP